jgi:hypothetical protein
MEVNDPMICILQSPLECCFITEIGKARSEKGMCYKSYGDRILNRQFEIIKYNEKYYEKQCIPNRNIQSSCGKPTPSIIKDCSDSSTDTNSCCFSKTDTSTSCVWYGSKYVGTIYKNSGEALHCDNPRGSTCYVDTGSPEATVCNSFSAKTNSCCKYKQGCIWWGETFKGTSSINGSDVICTATRTIYSVISLLTFLLLF